MNPELYSWKPVQFLDSFILIIMKEEEIKKLKENFPDIDLNVPGLIGEYSHTFLYEIVDSNNKVLRLCTPDYYQKILQVVFKDYDLIKDFKDFNGEIKFKPFGAVINLKSQIESADSLLTFDEYKIFGKKEELVKYVSDNNITSFEIKDIYRPTLE